VTDSLALLQARLGYTFRDPAHLESALTHRSMGPTHNERLEFLGDSIVNFVVAEALFQKYGEAREGKLTRMRAALVRGQSLSELARRLQLGEALRLGSGERKSGGRRRDSILADAMEAVIGAIYLDGGMNACQTCIGAWFEADLDRVNPDQVEKDPKTALQEWLQRGRHPLPSYVVMEVTGPAHQQAFRVHCVVDALAQVTEGTGMSRRDAEQVAAQRALELLQGG
jgi:ribonuclease III